MYLKTQGVLPGSREAAQHGTTFAAPSRLRSSPGSTAHCLHTPQLGQPVCKTGRNSIHWWDVWQATREVPCSAWPTVSTPSREATAGTSLTHFVLGMLDTPVNLWLNSLYATSKFSKFLAHWQMFFVLTKQFIASFAFALSLHIDQFTLF